MDFATAGRLEDTPTAELFHELAERDATGCLLIAREDREARIWFRRGAVYTATAPDARARLGDRLVGAGHLDEDALQRTLDLQRTLVRKRRIGELLIEQGLIDRETMADVVREQIADSVAVALGWTTGTWSFAEDEEVAEDVRLEMSIENLLMEAARRLAEYEVIQARLGSMDAVPDFAAGGSTADLSLTPDEWAMLTRIDGMSSVAEIAEGSGYGALETARIIYGLLNAGVISLVGDEGEPQEAPAGAGDRSGDLPGNLPGDLAGELAELGAAAQPLDHAAAPEAAAVPPPPADAVTDALADLYGSAPAPPAPPAPPGPGAEREPELQHEPQASEVPAPAAAPPAAALDRNELLREFAALDDDDDEEEQRPAIPPVRRDPVPPPAEGDRRGLFGRFKKG